jgi:hypothetical protein
MRLAFHTKKWSTVKKLIRYCQYNIRKVANDSEEESLIVGHILPFCCSLVFSVDSCLNETEKNFLCSYQSQRLAILKVSHLGLKYCRVGGAICDDFRSLLSAYDILGELGEDDDGYDSKNMIDLHQPTLKSEKILKAYFKSHSPKVTGITQFGYVYAAHADDSEDINVNELDLYYFVKAAKEFQLFMTSSDDIKQVGSFCDVKKFTYNLYYS